EHEREAIAQRLASENQRAADYQREGSLPGGVAPSAADLRALEAQRDAKDREIETARTAIVAATDELQRDRDKFGTKYPVLLVPDYTPGGFHGKSEEELSEATGEMLQKILGNIAKTKDNIADETIRIWHLREVPELAFQSLNVAQGS